MECPYSLAVLSQSFLVHNLIKEKKATFLELSGIKSHDNSDRFYDVFLRFFAIYLLLSWRKPWETYTTLPFFENWYC
jgi:hypothetical protein